MFPFLFKPALVNSLFLWLYVQNNDCNMLLPDTCQDIQDTFIILNSIVFCSDVSISVYVICNVYAAD